MPDVDVLIVGAGPTGLTLACWLQKFGVSFRIIDKAKGPGTASRALGVHARTLEFHTVLGIADEAVAAGSKFDKINYWSRGKHAARGRLGDVGAGLSPFPFALILPQDIHERMLIRHLEAGGARIEWEHELTTFSQNGEGVRSTIVDLATGEKAECTSSYICGCDGAHSTVRRLSRIGFTGGTDSDLFFVADVEGEGVAFNGELHAAFNTDFFSVLFPMKGERRGRLVGVVPEDLAGKPDLDLEDIHAQITKNMDLHVTRCFWFSSYHVHHRVAENFQAGRAFLLGDAGHIHSPAGAQGMNTGIGDAVNLSWKLAQVVRGRADPSLLESYEIERIRFARILVRTTDRAFSFLTGRLPLSRLFMLDIAPLILPGLLRMESVRREIFRRISQIGIHYRDSPLSRRGLGAIRGGDRLPWVPLPEGGSNFDPLRGPVWQVHVYGDPPIPFRKDCEAAGMKLVLFPWTDKFRAAGFTRGAMYLIRPDGHVAMAERTPDYAAITQYFKELNTPELV